jgi:fibronectin type 3 domain-containing protein
MDQTPPMAPVDFRVDPCTTPSAGLVLSWRKVTRDVQNHQELDAVQTYRIYRADNADALGDLTNLALYLKATVNANPGDPADMILSWTDTDPILVPPYGEKDFWYRVQCVDAHGNAGTPSVQISGRVPDTRPPGGTEVTDSKGYADHIQIFWDPNPELDLAGYQIYRSICDQGQPYRPRQDKEKLLGCDFVLVGDVSRVKAEELQKDSGSANFDDYSVPPGSPLCYAYWVRAYDASGNLYGGDSGCPMNDWEYICQRLYEKTPPPVPIITGLKAKNNAVLVEWIASPVQDLRAFHIYRGKREDDPPDFAGCVLSDGTLWPGKWGGLQPKCEDIPAEADPDTVHGSFLDKGLEPNLVYWYRVSALDWLGNESEGWDLRRIPAISTFTYSRDLPSTPALLPPADSPTEGCGLTVNWTPPFDPAVLGGFVVFRSNAITGNYRQVSPIITDNRYADTSALRGIDYWYRIQAVDKQGKLSQPSAPVKHRY